MPNKYLYYYIRCLPPQTVAILLYCTTTTSYLSHPEILIRKPIQRSKNLLIQTKFDPKELSKVFISIRTKIISNYIKKFLEMIRRLQLLIPKRHFIDPREK